jgi:hypothetical protein
MSLSKDEHADDYYGTISSSLKKNLISCAAVSGASEP